MISIALAKPLLEDVLGVRAQLRRRQAHAQAFDDSCAELGKLRIVLPTAITRAPSATSKTPYAANGPFAVRAVKRAVTACSGLPLEEAFVVENREKALVMASADAREGPRAFMEKRAPDYQGR